MFHKIIPIIIITDDTIDSSLVSNTAAVGSINTTTNKDSKDNNNNNSAINEANGRSAALERAYVHEVYENCEEPVGSIRPRVANFLSALDAGSVVCDVGCGNGRYLTAACNPSIVTIGVDRCFRLANVAKESGGEVSSTFCHQFLKIHTLFFIPPSSEVHGGGGKQIAIATCNNSHNNMRPLVKYDENYFSQLFIFSPRI